jgi:hypothetical protein
VSTRVPDGTAFAELKGKVVLRPENTFFGKAKSFISRHWRSKRQSSRSYNFDKLKWKDMSGIQDLSVWVYNNVCGSIELKKLIRTEHTPKNYLVVVGTLRSKI